MKATLSADGKSLRMSRGQWSMTIPVEEVPKWLDFYRGLWGRGAKAPGQPGPWAVFYEENVKALEFVTRMLARRVAS